MNSAYLCFHEWAWSGAVVLDTGAVSRGSGGKSTNRERDLRKKIVEADHIECVILLPANLFYNTTAPGVIILLNRSEQEERKNQILLINATNYFVKRKPKNELSDEGMSSTRKEEHENKGK